MRKMTSEEIRNTWLKFFESKGHHVEPSASLVPINDPTLLWINAGVAALKKYFDGSEIPVCRRITNAQKSIRTNDIENVGDATHLTFFEMLGNFSIGDYFRKEVIPWAVEMLFSPEWFNFPKERIYVTYHPDDLETKKCWMDAGIEESHLITKEDNFWEIGEGPCGPDTEVHFDRGEKYDPEHIGLRLLEEDLPNFRFVEIWNIVFSQFNSEPGKKRSEYKELPSKNIDTGAGLERFAVVLQETDTVYETDLFWPIIEHTEKIANKKYDYNMRAFRVIADHMRTCTFALSDGASFSNEGRGYVLRRLLRRASRYGKVLGINKPFLYELVDTVIEIMKGYYPYLLNKADFVKKSIKAEEEKFLRTLNNGEEILLKKIEGSSSLSGEDMFLLYDTFGFPKELTMEICDEHNVSYDIDRFNELMKEQRQRARDARGDLQSMNKQSKDLMEFKLPSEFTYDKNDIQAKVIGLFVNGEKVDSISESGEIIFDKTNFYAESGGQVADTGVIENESTSLKVNNVLKAPNKQYLHYVEVSYGEVRVGDTFTLKIDKKRRQLIMRNHSSVHLLQAALTEVLGDQIAQHGSYVSDEYSHFDFNHMEKVKDEELKEVERLVNQYISDGIEEETKVLPIEEAKKLGAKALFNDKYGDVVRVVTFGEVSKEFCGGTHVSNTRDIGLFVIESEESVASGVRRITARTSIKAYELLKKREAQLAYARDLLGASSIFEVNARLKALLNEKNALKKELETAKDKLANASANKLNEAFVNKDGIYVLAEYIKGASREALVSMADKLKVIHQDYVIVLIGETNLPILAMVGGNAKGKYHAGKLVKEIAGVLGGSGGGRDEFANGAGRDASKIDEALKVVK
ncbi:MAG: alanine--tRNA ligase [Erysipelotrichaceae bacterium]|nr:alanine--tRNA ligase [Erysipelotrichaceae bacterium]